MNIDADKLYKQVDELMAYFAKLEKEAEPDTEDLSIFYEGKKKMCSELLDIIDSLQKEQPSSNLDEAAQDFVWEVMENDEDGISELSRKLRPSSKIDDFYDALAEFFKAGAKWAIEQLKEK